MHVLVPLKFSTSFSLQEPLTATMLAAAPQQDQKQMLGERMFPLVQVTFPIFLGQNFDTSFFFLVRKNITLLLLSLGNNRPLVQVRFPIFFFWEQKHILIHPLFFLFAQKYLNTFTFIRKCSASACSLYVVWITFFTFTFQKRIKSIFPGHISRSGRQGDWDAVGH